MALLLVLAAALALALSAALTAVEYAVFSLADSRIRALVDEQFRGSEALARLRADPGGVTATLRAARALATAALAGCATLLGARFGAGWAVLALGAAALLLLVAGDVVPSALAARNNVRLALGAAPALLAVVRRLVPLLAPLRDVPSAAASRAGGAEAEEREALQISILGESEGVIEAGERQLIERALRLDELKAWDVMTPRVDIFAWPADRTLGEVAAEFASVPYSRVPVFDGTIDDVTGILYVRDAYQALLAGRESVRLGDLAREPLLVPGSISLTRLLREFQTRRIHMAVVVDEYGGTDGLVTLEDILEELVGEIEDELDIPEPLIVRLSPTEIVAAGDADVREINDVLRVSLPHLEHRSLNGYLLEELGRVPQQGERIEREGVLIEVLEASETQVLRAGVRRLVGSPEEGERGGAGRPTRGAPEVAPDDQDRTAPDGASRSAAGPNDTATGAPLARVAEGAGPGRIAAAHARQGGTTG